MRGAVAWIVLAVVLGISAQLGAWNDPPSTGRVGAGYGAYLSVLATLAGLISVLNARAPGGGAWALLMALLILVFLIPWLEAPGMARGAGGLARLRLGSPWTIFYVLLVAAGVTNYMPTRYGAAARALGHGGVKAVAGASGLSLSTVQNGARAVDAGIEPSDRVRAPGAGRTPSRTRRRTATPCTGSSTQVVRAAGEEAGDFSGAGGASGGVLGRLGQRR